MTDSPVPAPHLEGLTADFYGWLRDGELRVQECDACHFRRHIPRVLCPRCGGDAWHWHRCTGDGYLFSWTITHRPLHPAFTATPFTVAIVELVEGPRIIAPLLGGEDELHAGLPVRLSLQAADGPTIPVFTVSGLKGTEHERP